ncbi:MAG: threonylcarbamoyl-AMP synthase [Atopobiaceae bacterium]|jgi:tRNA threonylcarbamoyl adenosine modification protein (Sua5/YciO/YrdC/YwlC family)|nr:threonylcarbamoyl-AMP synthase [Atopobiaceae bacterium]
MGKVMPCDQGHPSGQVVDAAVRALAGGGVLVMPTDSVYGIGVAATPDNPGLERVFRIKRRPAGQTLPWLVAEADDLMRYGRDVPEWALRLARAFWPGALTLVVDAAPCVPAEYRRPEDGTIALRMPDSALVRDLARRMGTPLAVTSANTHGMPSVASGAELEPALVAEADLTLDGGTAPQGVASTIVGTSGEAPLILREGAISRRAIEEALS